MSEKFELYGETLEYSTEMVNYNTIYTNLKEIENEVYRNFYLEYLSKFHNMDAVMQGIDELVESYLGKGIDYALQCFADNGVYDYDTKRFMGVMNDNGYLDDLFGFMTNVEAQYEAILDDQAEAAAYRKARKASRGRWSGYDLESSAKAGAANFASGVGHTAVNAIGNAGSAIAASVKKGKMYNDKNITLGYQDGIVKTLNLMSYAIAKILNNETDCKVWMPTEDVINKTETIVGNIENGYLSEPEIIKEKCIELLAEYPYDSKVYECLRKVFDDDKGELDALALYHGSTVIQNYKNKKIKELLSDINYYTLDTIEQGKSEFNRWAERYNVDPQVYNKCLDDVRNIVDVAARTMDGNLYDTIGNAQIKRKQLLEIIENTNCTEGNDLDGINKIIHNLEQSEIASKEKYIQYLKEEIQQEDIRYKTVKDKVYETREKAEVARSEAEILDKIIFDLSTEDKLQEVKKTIEEITTEDIKEIYLRYIKECMELWNEQNSEQMETEIKQASLRKEQAETYYTAQLYLKKAQAFNCVKVEFKEWFDAFNNTYCTVNGALLESPEKAAKAYLKWVDHSRKYFEYIQAKNAEKKSLFGAFKNATSGLVYKNYEGEYNSLTNNGENPLPLDKKSDYEVIENIIQEKAASFGTYDTNMHNEYKRVFLPHEMQNKTLNVSELFEEDVVIESSEVLEIMKECCKSVEIKEKETV